MDSPVPNIQTTDRDERSADESRTKTSTSFVSYTSSEASENSLYRCSSEQFLLPDEFLSIMDFTGESPICSRDKQSAVPHLPETQSNTTEYGTRSSAGKNLEQASSDKPTRHTNELLPHSSCAEDILFIRAVTTLQSRWRTKKLRRLFLYVLESQKKMKEAQAWYMKATVVQKMWRGHSFRVKHGSFQAIGLKHSQCSLLKDTPQETLKKKLSGPLNFSGGCSFRKRQRPQQEYVAVEYFHNGQHTVEPTKKDEVESLLREHRSWLRLLYASYPSIANKGALDYVSAFLLAKENGLIGEKCDRGTFYNLISQVKRVEGAETSKEQQQFILYPEFEKILVLYSQRCVDGAKTTTPIENLRSVLLTLQGVCPQLKEKNLFDRPASTGRVFRNGRRSPARFCREDNESPLRGSVRLSGKLRSSSSDDSFIVRSNGRRWSILPVNLKTSVSEDPSAYRLCCPRSTRLSAILSEASAVPTSPEGSTSLPEPQQPEPKQSQLLPLPSKIKAAATKSTKMTGTDKKRITALQRGPGAPVLSSTKSKDLTARKTEQKRFGVVNRVRQTPSTKNSKK